MNVLAIDTSSPAVTAGVVALAGDAALLSVRAPIAARGHGELLSPSIRAALDEAGIDPGGIVAVVAGTGPGPFTGLRVGLVTAAAFADAIGVATYGVCSLDAIAHTDARALLVVTDARRREVYWARYAHGVRVGEPEVARPQDVPLDGVGAVAGAAIDMYDVWATLPSRPERYPDPLALVRLAADRIEGRAESELLVPRYLRRPDAVVPGAPKAVRR